MAFSSCQHWPSGFYGAPPARRRPDRPRPLPLPRRLRLRAGGRRRAARPDRRRRPARPTGASTRSTAPTPALRELHRLHPTAHVWDDHEVFNNYSQADPPPAAAQRSAAYRAAFEWLPRMTFPRERHRIYKRLQFGAGRRRLPARRAPVPHEHGRRPPRRMLGDAQMTWLLGELAPSRATWKIMAQQVVMAARQSGEEQRQRRRVGRLRRGPHAAAERDRAAGGSTTSSMPDRRRARLHDEPARRRLRGARGRPVPQARGGRVRRRLADQPGPRRRRRGRASATEAPWVQQFDATRHGYAQFDMRPDRLDMVYLDVPVFCADPNATIFERFGQPAGANRVERSPAPARRGTPT